MGHFTPHSALPKYRCSVDFTLWQQMVFFFVPLTNYDLCFCSSSLRGSHLQGYKFTLKF